MLKNTIKCNNFQNNFVDVNFLFFSFNNIYIFNIQFLKVLDLKKIIVNSYFN